MGRGKVIRYFHRIITKKDKTMKKLFKYTLSMVALCATLASCSDDTTTDGVFNPNNGKELISLSGNDNGVTRAALTRGGFSAETKVEMRIKAINKNDASAKARYAEATATASAATGSDLSNLSYASGLERYWDDAFGRESQLTIYAFAIPGQTSATLPTWSKSEWTAVDAQTNPNWYTSSADDTQVSWSVATEQMNECFNDSTKLPYGWFTEGWKVDPAWPDLLEKLTHRDYDTGFFFDAPCDDAKIDPDKSYNKPAFVVGVTDSFDSTTGLNKVTQKNKLYKGDTLNVLMPEGYMAPVVVSELYDGKMNPVNDCPHPEMTFFMKAVSSADGSVVELPPMSFLSRDGDKDFGIPAPQ